MELTQEIMDVYTAGSTKGGEVNWTERDDNAGLQAVLDFLAPTPFAADEMIENRTSMELSRVRAVLGQAEVGVRACEGYSTRFADPDPEQVNIVQALRTVVEMLRPWKRAR